MRARGGPGQVKSFLSPACEGRVSEGQPVHACTGLRWEQGRQARLGMAGCTRVTHTECVQERGTQGTVGQPATYPGCKYLVRGYGPFMHFFQGGKQLLFPAPTAWVSGLQRGVHTKPA